MLIQMKINNEIKTIKLPIKEKYTKSQTKEIRFVMTRNVYYSSIHEKIIVDNKRWCIRDHKTSRGICSAKTLKETRKNFFKMLSNKKFDNYYEMRTKGFDIVNTYITT